MPLITKQRKILMGKLQQIRLIALHKKADGGKILSNLLIFSSQIFMLHCIKCVIHNLVFYVCRYINKYIIIYMPNQLHKYIFRLGIILHIDIIIQSIDKFKKLLIFYQIAS